MRIDTQTLVRWLRASAEIEASIDLMMQAKQARQDAEERYGTATEHLLEALGIHGMIADVTLQDSFIEINKIDKRLVVHLDGRIEEQEANHE